MSNDLISPEQQTVLEHLLTTTNNLQIRSCAGGGKTSTLGLICKATGPSKRTLAIAFNKSAEENFKRKLPYFVRSQTHNAFCNDIWRQHFKKTYKVDGLLMTYWLKDACPEFKVRREIRDDVLQLVSFAKTSGRDSVESVIAHMWNLAEVQEQKPAAVYAEALLRRYESHDLRTIDFDDQLWLPLVHGASFPSFDLIVLDEAQDTNAAQRAHLRRMVPPARLIVVGDEHQAIYAFRGADGNAMDALREEFEMTPLALSVSWRCSKAVVAEAQKYL